MARRRRRTRHGWAAPEWYAEGYRRGQGTLSRVDRSFRAAADGTEKCHRPGADDVRRSGAQDHFLYRRTQAGRAIECRHRSGRGAMGWRKAGKRIAVAEEGLDAADL